MCRGGESPTQGEIPRQWLASGRPMAASDRLMAGHYERPMTGHWPADDWPLAGRWLANGQTIAGQRPADDWPLWPAYGWPLAPAIGRFPPNAQF